MSNTIIHSTKESNNSINKLIEPINKSLDVNYKPVNKTHQETILSLLMNNDIRKDSLKTTDTKTYKKYSLNYDLKEIKRFDEFNKSLSEISEFDLENDLNDNKSEFNSSDDDNSEIENIIIKSKIISNKRKNKSDYENEIEKEYEEIINILKIKQ